MNEDPILVLGAGPTGLSAAFHLGKNSLLVERENRVGGGCRSTYLDGFTFDFAGHILSSNDPYVNELCTLLLRDNVHWQEPEEWVYSEGVHTRYPFHSGLHGLPVSVVRECLVGALEANGHPLGDANGLGHSPQREPRNFEEFVERVWGAGIARHFAIPYNRKLWAYPLAEMEASWLGDRAQVPDLGQMIEGALAPPPRPMGQGTRFGYPMRGGFQGLMDAFLPYIKGHLRLNTTAIGISPSRREVRFHDGSTTRYERLISTLPLPRLVALLNDEAPDHVRDAAAGLRHVSVRCVHIGVGRERISDKHWIYYPGDSVFHRIFVQGNASPSCNPPGGFGLTCEITYSASRPLPAEGNDLIQRCVEDCRRVGIMREDDSVRIACQADLPYAYVVYDHGRRERVNAIRDWLRGQGVLLAGCFGEWESCNSDHAFIAGRDAALAVEQDLAGASRADSRAKAPALEAYRPETPRRSRTIVESATEYPDSRASSASRRAAS